MKFAIFYFIAGLFLGFIFFYFISPPAKIIFKEPYPKTTDQMSDVFLDDNGVCYKYKSVKVDNKDKDDDNGSTNGKNRKTLF